MKKIPISLELESFDRHLADNPRIIFSAKYGDGKSCFIQDFIEEHKDYKVLTLRPVTYSVSKNEDVFEYIKRDILLQLAEEGGLREPNMDLDAFCTSVFNCENMIEALSFMISSIPGWKNTINYIPLLSKVAKIKEKYDNRKVDIKSYIDKFSQIKGCIYEDDAYTFIIRNSVKKLKSNFIRSILIIEDMDRIDPAHLFRILNVLAAHMDENTETNKFGFDNIVVVLDYDVTKHIFLHFYGNEANYEGYMKKFISHYPFRFSITETAVNYFFDFLISQCGGTREFWSKFRLPVYNSDGTDGDIILLDYMQSKSVRDIAYTVDNLENQYLNYDITLGNGKKINTKEKIVIFLSLLKRLQVDITTEYIKNLVNLNDDSILLLGGLLFVGEVNANGGYFRYNHNEYTISVEERNEFYITDIKDSATGLPLQKDINKLVSNAIRCAAGCVNR